ncbi:MAG: metal ABC transporter permease [Alphaproteobacteria bacterium HGW-Alphaproteobacteria-2]|nr:MAG: metal ABC transporter permease [Alphaproteobacteria bacterium HGW-Alphaproteobacteria-2]
MRDSTPAEDQPVLPSAAGWRIVARVAPALWPAGVPWVKRRVVLALAALVAAKLVTVATPMVYKAAVDALAPETPSPAWALGAGAVGLTLAYGAARFLTVGFTQGRDALFARVGQRALRILLFSILPLILELAMVAAIFATFFGWSYLAVLAGAIAAYVAFTFRVTEWRVAIRREMNAQDTDANQKAIDSLLNYETVKYFAAEAREAERYDRAMRGYERAAVKTGLSLAFLNAGQSLIITLALVAVMAMAAMGVQAGRLTVGDFVMVNAYMIQIAMPLNLLGSVYREIRQSLVDMAEMFGLLDRAPEVADAPGAPALAVPRGAIVFDDVRFGYGPDREILKGLSLSVTPGARVAIVGPSGSGKSTIARLIFRFYDVTGGAIRIDGQDIRAVTQASLHRAIGIVPQDTVLFNDTIGYNIAYGRAGASHAEVEAAARAAALHGFIASLPQGYDTPVGERGLKLSGGEKQRVGIARTLLKDPPVLILDEATSALDSRTEAEIQESLALAGRGRTVITIAHRLSTVADSDLIVVLEAGRIAEQGSHAALLAAGGLYAAMWARQQAEPETGTEIVTGPSA